MKDKLWFQQLFQISPTPDTFVLQFAAKLFILDILATIKIGQKHFLHNTFTRDHHFLSFASCRIASDKSFKSYGEQ